MTRVRASVLPRVAAATTVILMLAMLALGCGCSGESTTQRDSNTALAALQMIEASVEATIPDAQLLLVQTERVVTATSTPEWCCLYASPSTGDSYVAMIQDGAATVYSYSTVTMTAAQWAGIPSPSLIAVDSDQALEAARAAYEGGTDGSPYMMGLLTYVPEDATSTVQALVWYVTFDPAGSNPVEYAVDAQTGEVTKR